jgi:hypothetical protein
MDTQALKKIEPKLAEECEDLNLIEEKKLAEEGMNWEMETWPEY